MIEVETVLSRLRGEMEDRETNLIRRLQDGDILVPSTASQVPNRAGGVNRFPNADLSYSTLARVTAGTTPATAGDTNQESYRHYRQAVGANLTLDGAHALKAVGHSLYAAAEGADAKIPDWDRVNGWARLGSTSTQYDIAIALLENFVRAGKPYYVRMKLSALDETPVPADVQVGVGFWETRAASEGWIEGGSFQLGHLVKGIPGSTSTDYRVLAKTDNPDSTNVEVLSDVLTVANAPDSLSTQNYVQLFFNAGPGFIEYQVYKKVGGIYYHVYTIRNSTDLLYNDTGYVRGQVGGWPTVTVSAPRAIAETRNVRIGAFGQTWGGNDLTIQVPSLYIFANSVRQFLRIWLTAPTGVNRHIGIDQVWLSDTYNEWTEDHISPFADGTYPLPSISPLSGFQGGGGGVISPPSGGSGGETCILKHIPVLTISRGRNVFRAYEEVKRTAKLLGEHKAPYDILRKREGVASGYYVVTTRNGVTVECNAKHRFIVDTKTRRMVEAGQLTKGASLAGWTKGRKVRTKVKSIRYIPEPAEVGTFILRHPEGLSRDGHGMFIAGMSKDMDRGIFNSNVKLIQQ